MFFNRLQCQRADISTATFWFHYQRLLNAFKALAELPNLADVPQSQERLDRAEEEGENIVSLLPNLEPLRHGQEAPGAKQYFYIGGLQNAPALPEGIMQQRDKELTDTEDESLDANIGLGLTMRDRLGIRAKFTPPP